MANTTEPRALQAALSSPVFLTRAGGGLLHAADRHVERWAPETTAHQLRPMRNLGFVDRLVSPWIESAQRSPSLRMFSQYVSRGAAERPVPTTSWLFPRPWYQDELDWMAAARHQTQQTTVAETPAPSMFTTRGTYVAPQQPTRVVLPANLHEYVAPSLSVARPEIVQSADAYSPLVPFAAAHAAQVMASAVAPLLQAQTRQPTTTASIVSPTMSASLRTVLTTMLERSTRPTEIATRASQYAPAMVTPPAPRPEVEAPVAAPTQTATQATELAERYAEQRARIVELQRVARATAERETLARTQPETTSRIAEIQQRATEAAARREEARQVETQRRDVAAQTERVAAAEQERARLEERIAQRLAERTRQQDTQRLHETAREAAARDARVAPTPTVPVAPAAAEAAPSSRITAELASAVAALPPELATMVAGSISQRPERAAQAIAELGEALRTVELLARTTASGGSIAPARGPRLVMPAGLGGLVSTVQHTVAPTGTAARVPQLAPVAQPAPLAAQAPARMPAMTWLAAPGRPMPTITSQPAPTSALGAAMQSTPAALHHVAWSDRWLARFAGAQPQSLDVFSTASGESRMAMLAAAAPGAVFVAPSVADEPAIKAPTRAEIAAARTNEVVRYDDNAETPDEVLFAIAAASRSARPAGRAAAAPAAPVVPTYDPQATAARETLADVVAHAAPVAPGAGLSAQLASSPFAPALKHVLPIAAAPSFDVRSLFGSAVGATYLAGLLASPTDEIAVPRSMPTWAAAITDAELPTIGERAVESFAPTYVAPSEAGEVTPEQAEVATQAAAAAAPLTTLRSALLSFDVEAATTAPRSVTPMLASAITAEATAPSLARSLVEPLALPTLADTAAMRDAGSIDVAGATAHVPSYGAPGMVADRAYAWSVAQERSSADLSFDFVTPELVLAARVYGLGPAEAAQAARLAIAGPGALSAMAGAVDRTFVQAMAIEAERRQGRARIATAYPIVATADGAQVPAMPQDARPTAAGEAPAAPTATYAPSTATFGVEKRTPRGSYLWPAATTAALGLSAPAPDGDQSMSVAALELLAAQAVAELGTYSALGEVTEVERRALASVAARAESGATVTASAPGAEPTDDEVLSSAAAFVPTARRDKFHALYLALSQSPSGRTASPAARAARALALAGRGEETITARERASVAWDVLPVVFGPRDEEQPTALSTGEQLVRAQRRREELRAMDPTFVDVRPGLGPLSARAGEALGSYVKATDAAAPQAQTREREAGGAVMRAPTAAQELVQTGRPAGRFGGGEVEIPTWFEQAARKMLAERTAASSSDFSLAELTLVTSAPAPQIAAASRGPSAHTPSKAPSPDSPAAAGGDKDKVDIEKAANEIYREVLCMMDIARIRNGEPYL